MASFTDQLNDFFLDAGLQEKEALILATLVMFPGLSNAQIQYQTGLKRMSTYRTLERLEELGYVQKMPSEGGSSWQAIALDAFLELLQAQQLQLQEKAQDLIKTQHLLSTAKGEQEPIDLKRYTGDRARELYSDMHYLSWEYQCGLGDFEEVSKSLGMEFCLDWIDQRVRRGRQAGGYFTTTGENTRYIVGNDQEHLRKSPKTSCQLKNQWVEIFPENDIVLLFEGTQDDWSMLKIDSRSICQSYFNLARAAA